MNESQTTRRNFLEVMAASALLSAGCKRSGGPPARGVEGTAPGGPADVTLHIDPVLADIAKHHTVNTLGYNGTIPGPVIRLREGVP